MHSLPSNWSKIRFSDYFRIKHGYAFKGEYFSSHGEYVVLTPGNFFEEGGFRRREGKDKFYTGPIPSAYVLKRNDLIVAMTEQGEGLLGSAALVPNSEIFLHNQRLGLITDLDDAVIDKHFLYYLFNTRPIRDRIRATANGAKVRHTSPSRICEISVFVPSVETQRKIAAVLSAYDDLIENNQRRIRILEDMAQAIYREWFVEFRYPGHEGVELVETGDGRLPEGWSIAPIGDVVETLGGGTPSTTEPEYWDGDITWYSPTDLTGSSSMFMFSSAKSISERGLGKSSARLFPAYSVMMTSRATIGVVAINTCEACTNQGFITCVPSSDVPLYQLYYWVRENTDKIKLLATGATFKEINKTTFRQLPIAVADATTRKAFTEMVGPIDKQVENILRKNANLRQTRDLLLPNLISGELDVADLDIATKELN